MDMPQNNATQMKTDIFNGREGQSKSGKSTRGSIKFDSASCAIGSGTHGLALAEDLRRAPLGDWSDTLFTLA